jgi:putative membrane protein
MLGQDMGSMMNQMMGGWWGFGMMWLVGLFSLLLFALLIAGVVLLVLHLTKRPAANPGPGPANRALEILKERYARGEIGKEEFEAKRQDLA